MILVRLTLILTCLSLLFLAPKFSAANQFGLALADAAEQQVGVTVTYDPSYVSIPFPGGDIPRDKGVCSDVFIRALRDAHQIDLQQRVNTDMKKAFSRYPKTWGLKSTDPSIDHRRVYNLQRFLERQGFSLPVSSDANDYLPGDIVTWMLPGNLPHLGLVSDKKSLWSDRYLVIHNIGAGTQIEDRLFDFDVKGHYRITQTF
jgi:uncharacterized protein